jgi:hypothetical protein
MNVNRRELFYTVSMLMVIALIVFFLNIVILSSAWSVSLYRGQTQVKAVSIHHTGKPHFLSAEQKKEILSLLNEGELCDKPSSAYTASFKKVFLHSFGESSIEVVPVGMENERLILSVQNGQERTYLVEKQPGEIQRAISKALED